MKIKGASGEYAFRALFLSVGATRGWYLSDKYYFTESEVKEIATNLESSIYRWPVDQIDGAIYVPTQEELEND